MSKASSVDYCWILVKVLSSEARMSTKAPSLVPCSPPSILIKQILFQVLSSESKRPLVNMHAGHMDGLS